MTADREDLIDAAWQAIADRNDVDVSLRDLAEAAVDATAARLTAERDALREAGQSMLNDYEDQHGKGFCECTPAHETGICPACLMRAALNSTDGDANTP